MTVKIIEGNKLIAAFMGATFYEQTDTYNLRGDEWTETKEYVTSLNVPYNFSFGALTTNSLRYNYSWDWLMPVIDKIESTHDENGLRPRVTIDSRFVKVWNHEPIEIHTFDGESKLESTWHAAIDFIKWLNKR